MSNLVISHDLKDAIPERLGISFARARVLRRLTGGPLTLKELAEKMNSDPPYATLMVDDLEDTGLVERQPHPDDRRAKLVVLTPKGRELAEQADAILSEPAPGIKDLSDEDLATLVAILERCA